MQYTVTAPWGLELWLARLCTSGHRWLLQLLWEAVIWLRCAWSVDPGLWLFILLGLGFVLSRLGWAILLPMIHQTKVAR